MRSFLALFLLALTLTASAQQRVVQIIADGSNGFNVTFNSETNELVTLIAVGYSNTPSGMGMRRIVQGNPNWSSVGLEETYLGKASYQLTARAENINAPYFWAIFRVETVNTTGVLPSTALVLPAGQAANVSLEMSGDLFTWSPLLLATNLPTVGTNRFFRIRLD